jgi:hypothetical protein
MFDAQVLTALRKCEAGRKLSHEALYDFAQDCFARWRAFCDTHDADDEDALDDFIDETLLALCGEDMDASLDAAELLDALIPFLPEP